MVIHMNNFCFNGMPIKRYNIYFTEFLEFIFVSCRRIITYNYNNNICYNIIIIITI